MLRLRNFKQEDKALLVNYLNNPDVKRFLSPKIPSPYTIDDARWWVEEGSKVGITRAIEVNGQLAGSIGALPGQFEYAKSAEIGYWLAKEFWGKGIAVKALRALFNEVQLNTDIVRLHAVVFAGNTQSIKVLEKSGFEHEGLLKKAIYKQGTFCDAGVYGKIIN
ncbi:GNAT family N-acetyltransferase [Pseudoalteromonas sp. SaAl2]